MLIYLNYQDITLDLMAQWLRVFVWVIYSYKVVGSTLAKGKFIIRYNFRFRYSSNDLYRYL